MDKNLKNTAVWSIERKALLALLVVFAGVILSAWVYAIALRQKIATRETSPDVDSSALVEVEHLRNVAESQLDNARAFFLLGSNSLFDKQKRDKQALMEGLTNFERQYNLAHVPDVVKRMTAIEQQNEEIFDQAMEFRKKLTESKIVGQFYQSKTNPLRNQLNESFDELSHLHRAEMDRIRSHSHDTILDAETQIPRAMAWFTGLLTLLFVSLALLVNRLLAVRVRHLTERDRLYAEAKKAVQDRDEVIAAISYDLKEPLEELTATADRMKKATEPELIADGADFIRASAKGIEGIVKDICDQKKSDMGGIALRLDQLGIDEILDDARLIMQPLAKQRDIRLQFDSVNPPVLAFFDRERVIRVLANLVGNAIKFSPKHSRVVVKVRSDQKFVYISVTDTGPGIPEGQLSEVFDHFWQARKTASQGAGLGLAIVKTIVEAQGGAVSVDSKVGQGSTFTFSLPRRRPVGAHVKRSVLTVKHGANGSPRPASSEFQEGPSL